MVPPLEGRGVWFKFRRPTKFGPPSQRKILSEKTLKKLRNKAETSPKQQPNNRARALIFAISFQSICKR